jgi:hypothetical protein
MGFSSIFSQAEVCGYLLLHSELCLPEAESMPAATV